MAWKVVSTFINLMKFVDTIVREMVRKESETLRSVTGLFRIMSRTYSKAFLLLNEGRKGEHYGAACFSRQMFLLRRERGSKIAWTCNQLR